MLLRAHTSFAPHIYVQDIHFFAGVGPISINYLNATSAAVTQAQSLGLKATLVDMQACDKGGGGCQGCATHPGIDGHRRMYEMSYPVMKAALGW